ncbi:MAG: alpha/beta hydrolase family protein [Woeseiaceae bacterium]
MFRTLIGLLAACISMSAVAQSNRIDIVRHDAPELARFGEYDIGVRTLELTDNNRPDVLNTVDNGETAYYDRNLTVEVWYPALLAENEQPGTEYTTPTRNLDITATLHGRATRNARPRHDIGAVPLVIISHGYPGNRYLMSHLGENLASKGYVVASIDHRESTYTDQAPISSTLYHRPLDQLFVLDQMTVLADDTTGFLSGLVDTDSTGIVGYSMGGYGLVINVGGGYSETLVAHEMAPPNGLAVRHAASNPDYRENLDSRIKAAFAVAPWGMANGVWNPDDLTDIEVPSFYLSGSVDTTAGYESGTRAIFESAKRSDRYLLTYVNAGHNAGAPIPLPIEIQTNTDQTGASHYTDPVWDSVRMNNIMDHFATAFFDYNLKGQADRLEYLTLVPNAHDGVFSKNEEQETEEHTYWKGFKAGTARGLMLEHLGSAQ